LASNVAFCRPERSNGAQKTRLGKNERKFEARRRDNGGAAGFGKRANGKNVGSRRRVVADSLDGSAAKGDEGEKTEKSTLKIGRSNEPAASRKRRIIPRKRFSTRRRDEKFKRQGKDGWRHDVKNFPGNA